MGWKFKEQYKDIKITTADRVTVDKFTITDELVNHLLQLHSEHQEYFERDPKGDLEPAGYKPKRQRDEG